MNILFIILAYLNWCVLGLTILIASPMLVIIFCNIVCIRYLRDKPTGKEHFKNYCWTMYVVNCDERANEGEGLITFLDYMGKNEEFLKDRYKRILKNEL